MERKKDRVLAPSVVMRFQYKGTACRYTCCGGWEIFMRQKEYHQWKKQGIFPFTWMRARSGESGI